MRPPSFAAADARRGALRELGVYRALHTTESAGLCALDVLQGGAGRAGVLSLYVTLDAGSERELARAAAGALGLDAVYPKRRPRDAHHLANVAREELAPAAPLWGRELPELEVPEGPLRLRLRPGGDLSYGIFPDARPAREWVHKNSAGLRVLNLFAYTCGFGVSAGVGGAMGTRNLDLSRRVLEWGQDNYRLSGVDPEAHDFVYGDVFGWLPRFERRGDRYDLIVCDPPSFSRNGRRTWRAERDYAGLAAALRPLLAPGGTVLALCNHAGLGRERFAAMLADGLGGAFRLQEELGPGPDYPGAEHLKVQVWQEG